MFVEDLDGNSYHWKAEGHEVTQDNRPRSNLHIRARELIKERFPTLQILEEVPFKPRSRQTLYLDFYIPLMKIAIEVHGEQHYKYNRLYHNSIQDFRIQLKNDSDKKTWCDINGIRLMIFKYNLIDNWKI